MSKLWIVTLLGLLVALTPFLGFPGSVRTIIIVLLGLLIAIISFRIFFKTRYNSHAFSELLKRDNTEKENTAPRV